MEHWLEHEIGSTMKDRSNNPSHHEQMLLLQSYISLPKMEESYDLWTTL